jgi:hypothetical protein
MARARNIKPSFFTNERLAEIQPLGRLLFAGLWTLADREGRLADRPRRIKAEVLPYDGADVDGLLNELLARDFIVRYEAGGERYIQIIAFGKHQNPHIKEAASTIPAWDGKRPAPEIPALAPEIPALAGLIPDSGFLIPDSPFLIPDPPKPQSQKIADPPAKKTRGAAATLTDERKAQARAVWQAYSEAYAMRYAVAPVRNAKVSAQVVRLLDLIPADEAPEVARHFVGSGAAFYVGRGHDFGLLVADAGKLRTEWATGTTITATGARQSDRTAQTGQVFGKLIHKARDGTNG